jgi:ATP-dependent RNA/DNA helicase IGHMBP2
MRSGRLAHVSRLLDTQYRMHKMIADWASNSSYQGKLMTDESIAGHVLLDLNGVDRALLEETESASPMLLIDTSGCCMEEDQGDSASHSNRMEAQVVEAYVMSLLEAGIRAEHIGVITPYNGQLELLKGIFCEKFPALEVKTVDGFQGGEKEAIVISFVRSNEKREVGFLSDERRINVAVTRAKRQVAIICDVETCSSDPFLRSLLTYMSFNGDHRTAFDFMESPITQAPSKTDCNLTIFGCKVSDNVGFEPPDNVGLPEPKTKKKAATFVLNKRNSHATSKLSLSEYNSIVDAALLDVVEQIAQRSISGGTVRIVPYHIARLEKLDSKSIVSLGVGDSALVVEFPHSLTSFQRMTLHALADKLGLFHRSSGEDIARLLQISSQDFEVTTNPLDLNLNLSLDEFSSGKNTSDVKDFEGQKDLRVRPTVKSIEVKKVALRPAYVSAQKEVYMSTDRLAQQQKLIAIDDEEAMLEAAIQQNSVSSDNTL